MRKFSRWMPPATRRKAPVSGWLFLAVLIAAALAATISWPVPAAVIASAFVAISLAINRVTSRRLHCLAVERPGEDIGSFARAFDRRAEPFDPWVVRATWDALKPYLEFNGGRVPLRPTDRLDLLIDPEDLAFEVYEEVAARTGRSVDLDQANPMFGKVVTVGDFVKFVTLQPRVAEECKSI